MALPPSARDATMMAIAWAALLFSPLASGQTVALQGMLGSKALLIVDGSAPRTVAPGESFKGVKVVSTSGDVALVEIAGRRHSLRVGDSPASVGASSAAAGAGRQIMITAASGGHFIAAGQINGQQVRFMVDTGASVVAMSETEARRIGVDYKNGHPGRASTANGVVTTWNVKLAAVRVGDVEIRDVEASVLPAAMPYVLLGNAFLSRFQMKRDNDIMVLERRY